MPEVFVVYKVFLVVLEHINNLSKKNLSLLPLHPLRTNNYDLVAYM